jgi:hypothetical protein
MDNQNWNFDAYDVAIYAEAICDILDAFDTLEDIVSTNKDYNKYYDILFDLFEYAYTNNIVDEVYSNESKSGGLYALRTVQKEYMNKLENSHQEDMINNLAPGDLVLLKDGRQVYVVDQAYDSSGCWVTTNLSDRTNKNARGYYVFYNDITEILGQ